MADPGGSASHEDLTLQPTSAVTKARPRALWGVLAAVVLAAGALAVTSGDDGGERPVLPVALGASGAGGEAAMAADMSLAYVTNAAGDGLPALGGEAEANRLSGTVDQARVLALATALGFEDPARLLAEGRSGDGTWRVESGHGTLEVYEAGGGAWMFSSQQLLGDGSSGSGSSSSGSAGCEPGPAVDCGFAEGSGPITTVPGTGCAYDGSTGCATTQTAMAECPPNASCLAPGVDPACPPDAVCAEPLPLEPTPPADLPSKDEAQRIAMELLSHAGMDVDDATVSVNGPSDAWYITVEPRIDGLSAVGWQANVGVGPKGTITMASGLFGTPERLGRYPLIDTDAAIERLNALQGGGIMPMIGRGDIAVDSGAARGSAEAGAATDCSPMSDDVGGTISCAEVTTTSTVVSACKVQPDGTEICETPSSPPSVACVAPPTEAGTDPAAQDRVGCGLPEACYDTAKPLDESASETTIVDPACVDPMPMPDPGPAPEPEPVEITLTKAEPVLILMPAVDGGPEIYVVPGYRFSNADGVVVEVAAVADESLAPTTTIATQVSPPTEPPVSATTDCAPLVEGDGSDTTRTVLPCPPEPELGPPDSEVSGTAGGAAEG
jgi:hypothetical protein